MSTKSDTIINSLFKFWKLFIGIAAIAILAAGDGVAGMILAQLITTLI